MFDKFLESKGITKEQFEALSQEETDKLQLEYNTYLTKQMEGFIEKAGKEGDAEALKQLADIVDVMKEIKEIHTKTVTSLEETVKQQGLKIVKFEENQTKSDAPRTIREAVKAALLEKKEDLAKLKDNSAAKVKIIVKAPVAMTFATNTTDVSGRREHESGIIRDLRRTPMLLDLFNVSNTNARTFTWVEKTGREGGVAMVAEGTVKPLGDFDLQEFEQKPKKEAIIITVSKEMLDDIEGMAQEVEFEVQENIRLFTEDISLNGDGTGENIVGMDANATPFAAGSFAGTVDNATIFDVIRVAINQVMLNFDMPDYVLLHPSDATKMELQKDTRGQYVLPPFISNDGTMIKGLPVKMSTVVTEGEGYVGNMNRYKVKIREAMEMEIGYRGAADDWAKNMISFLGEQRLFGFIPQVHYGSIVKFDITAAAALLETP